MAEYVSVSVPTEIVNDDVVTLVMWHVTNGEKVRSDQVLFEIETSKSSVSVEAKEDGYVEHLEAAGTEVRVGAEIGRLHKSPISAKTQQLTVEKEEKSNTADNQQISSKAQKLIDSNGIDPAAFRGMPLVRESDVLEYLAKHDSSAHKSVPTPNHEQIIGEAPPSTAAYENKSFFYDVRNAAQGRGRGILWLASNYFFRNYLLGLLVRVAPRGLILVLHRMRGVKMGKGCFIDPTAIIETAYPENITIGNDVRITARAVIMSHIKPPHYLSENKIVPITLKKVVFEDHCFIGVNAVIMPGVTVGKAAVVSSGAVVFNNVPPYTMVGGNPAQIIKRFEIPERVK